MSEQADLRIRPATPEDAAHMTVLIDTASDGLSSHFWHLSVGMAESPVALGRTRALREEADFSYRNTTMAEIGGRTAGGMVGYVHGEEELADDTPPVLVPLAELGTQLAGYWYVNVLAVYPEFRGHGAATRLLEKADEFGRLTNAKGMALIVASGNEPAYRLYRKQGYQLTDRREMAPWPNYRPGQEWHLLTKPVPGA